MAKLIARPNLISKKKEEKQKPAPAKKEKLPSDKYKDEIEPIELKVSDTSKIVFSVKRAGDDGLPHVDIRLYVESKNYSGPTQKGVHFPIEFLNDFIDNLMAVNDECEGKNL